MSVVAERTVCPVTREEFKAKSKPITAKIGDREVTLDAREFSTGSFGWYVNQKISVDIGGKSVLVQVQVNATVVGSKNVE